MPFYQEASGPPRLLEGSQAKEKGASNPYSELLLPPTQQDIETAVEALDSVDRAQQMVGKTGSPIDHFR